MELPLDLELILGNDTSSKEMGSLNTDFILKPDKVVFLFIKIKALLDRLKLKDPIGEDMILKF